MYNHHRPLPPQKKKKRERTGVHMSPYAAELPQFQNLQSHCQNALFIIKSKTNQTVPISSLTSNNQDQHLQPPTVKMTTVLASGNIDLRKIKKLRETTTLYDTASLSFL